MKLAKRTVYVAGIPVKASPTDIYNFLNESSKVQEFYTPRSGKNNNRHFGFAVCDSEAEKEKLLAQRTIKTDRFKLLIRTFDFDNYFKNIENHKVNRDLLRGRTLKFHKRKIISHLFSGKPAQFLLGGKAVDSNNISNFEKNVSKTKASKQAVIVALDEDGPIEDYMHTGITRK